MSNSSSSGTLALLCRRIWPSSAVSSGRAPVAAGPTSTQGAATLRTRYPEAVTVFIMAPSPAELEARLRERKSDAAGEIARRLVRARAEMAQWREYDYLIINKDVKEAVERLATIIQGERWRTSRLTLKFPDVEVPQ